MTGEIDLRLVDMCGTSASLIAQRREARDREDTGTRVYVHYRRNPEKKRRHTNGVCRPVDYSMQASASLPVDKILGTMLKLEGLRMPIDDS